MPPFTKLIEKGMFNDSVLMRNERECKIMLQIAEVQKTY